MRIEGIEDDLLGINKISASYQKQQLVVDFDENLLTEEKIIASIEKLGYHPEPNQ
jgi:copper chaperone CopZ